MATQIKFFRASDEGAEWHAYREESAAALCGEATLSYNRDQVSDFVPSDGALHLGCREAIDAENPAPYQPYVETETQTVTDGDVASLADVTPDPAADASADAAAEAGTDTDAGTDATDGVPADDAPASDTADAAAAEIDQPQQ